MESGEVRPVSVEGLVIDITGLTAISFKNVHKKQDYEWLYYRFFNDELWNQNEETITKKD